MPFGTIKADTLQSTNSTLSVDQINTLGVATTAEALAGTANNKVVTPQTVQAVVAKNVGTYTTKSAAYTAVSGDRILANSTSAAFTVTLPASPAAGDFVEIYDVAGTFSTNSVTVGRSGNNIAGVSLDLILNVNRASVRLTYVGAGTGWAVD